MSDLLPLTLEIATVGKAFEPKVLVVPVESRVRFPNRDAILHNVFSVSPVSAFDLGLYGKGAGEEASFERPGVVRVFCNVHHAMVAYVVVVETPFWTRPAADGSFVLEGVPDGPGQLTVWHERADPYVRTLSILEETSVAVELAVTKPRVPKHMDKNGRSYRRRRYGGQR